ncbi:hypothetical protein AC579_7882 [Pseudocercospora musae]|uniref:Uncharacterized protein n=1 Tax=Pseudocercospora musae TaxID=113226 RepID=A0A139I7B8_9PEZI|nr:hypothetical protein AC579_7882 [Pseudocercospora musae]
MCACGPAQSTDMAIDSTIFPGDDATRLKLRHHESLARVMQTHRCTLEPFRSARRGRASYPETQYQIKMSSQHGQKVTTGMYRSSKEEQFSKLRVRLTLLWTDPATLNDPKNEAPGMVTSDSLAAESIREGGSFAANSDSRGPMAQPSRSVNTNTSDTSNAIRLDPATDAAAREAQQGWGDQSQLNAGSKLGKASGVGPTYNSVSGAASRTDEGATYQPKGQHLQEGGFDAGAPNASYTSDIGGKNDPGRVALKRAQEADVPSSGGAGPREGQISNDGKYDSLAETSA